MIDGPSVEDTGNKPAMHQPWSSKVRIGSRRQRSTGFWSEALPRNTLLAALADTDLAEIRPYLELVPLRQRQVLHERNAAVSYVYFIECGTVSLLSHVAGRDSLEVGTLGRDDILGVSVVLGTARAPHRCVVQVPGEGLRIRTEDLRTAMASNPVLHSLLLANVQATLVQSAQLLVCNTYHGLNERLARSLLMTLDRLSNDEVPLTHRSLSRSLGVRRASVTTALGAMEGAALLRRSRGHLKVLDRQRLEQVACECHRVVRTERERLLCEAGAVQGGAQPPENGRFTTLLPATRLMQPLGNTNAH